LQLLEFKKKHGHMLVSTRNPQLGRWVRFQREQHKSGSLKEERIVKPNEVGFIWEVDTRSKVCPWEDRLSQLLEYKEEHGHMFVPKKYERNPQLGEWVAKQRQFHKSGSLNEERIAKLNEVGFVWEAGNQWTDQRWEDRFLHLLEFKEKHGHTLVPQRFKQNPQLGTWVNEQRQLRKSGKLKEDRTAKLNEVGFIWEVESNMFKLPEHERDNELED
jgi:ribosomal protein L24E